MELVCSILVYRLKFDSWKDLTIIITRRGGGGGKFGGSNSRTETEEYM